MELQAMSEIRRRSSLVVLPGLVLAAAGCVQEAHGPAATWAMDLGGEGYVGGDGVSYAAEEFVSGGTIDELTVIKGSQDPDLYRYFRRGSFSIAKPMQNGVYDVTLFFAEPDDVGGGERVFDTLVEGQVVIRDLDIMASRDGKTHSALTITVPGVELGDGEFNIDFAASAGEPVLSAVLVRTRGQPGPDWKLVWSDEFDYSGSPDPDRWQVDRWPARKVNDEDQAYTERPGNLRVEAGNLVIEAHREEYDDAAYTSGRIHTYGTGDILYGRVEVRAKLPRGKGTWPAIWMLPSDPYRYATLCAEGDEWQGSPDCDAWPNSGEIDIMEHVGYQMGHVHGTVHNEAYYWARWEQRKGRILLDDVDEAFHVYALEWSPQRIDVFADDALYFTYVNEGNGWRSWPYDQPFNLILNVAVGGMWGRAGGGIDDSIFPQRMLVDYVRVYARQ